MSSKGLIIVESPAKARTIAKFLDDSFVVESSIGHVRDLPAKSDEIPANFRSKPWARTGVDIENAFQPLWIVPAAKKQQVAKLKQLLKDADMLYLATDEDREGEAIAWHLREVLKPKIPCKRMVFHEITSTAIRDALENPRDVDLRLVDAQEARRILDRLYGYELSPVLWRKIRPRLSAGRVQSVATRLVVQRERQRMVFRTANYWSLNATLAKALGQTEERSFVAELSELDGRRVAVGRHFDPTRGELSDDSLRDKVLHLQNSDAEALEAGFRAARYEVADTESKPFTQRPHPPFITSTLQQEAGRKIGYTAARTMRVAQRLYEQGYITYMRTDSTQLSEQAIAAARSLVETRYGKEYLPDKARVYTRKSKGAQEAHEAIRPAGEVFRRPDELSAELDGESLRLYELIWKRTVASQMCDARGERSRVRVRATLGAQAPWKEGLLSASGKVILFPGYLLAYVEGADDPEAELEDRERILPKVDVGDQLSAREVAARSHNTQPPARYTEASLVKELEEKGIGRPSTYASIIQTIQDRGYVWKQGSALVPTLTAFAVTKLLEEHFATLVDYDFTARMESDLDAISSGAFNSKPWLHRFYFGAEGDASTASADTEQPAPPGLREQVGDGVDAIDPREICSVEIGKTPAGEKIAARVGRYGPYLQVGDSDQRAPLPDSIAPDELSPERALELFQQQDKGNRELGIDPESGKTIYLKTGAYGPYVQLGEPELTPKGNLRKGGKPRTASLWPDMNLETVDLAQALAILAFPKVLGQHPDSKEDVVVQDGKFGPYVQSVDGEGKRQTRSLRDHEHLRTINLSGALEVLAQPRQRGAARQQKVLAELGVSEVTQKPIEVRNGRFGPYVTDGQVNATIPRGQEPAQVSLDQALELIAQREQKMRDQGKEPRPVKKTSKKTTKKTPAKTGNANKKSVSKKKQTTKKAAKKPTKKNSPKAARPG